MSANDFANALGDSGVATTEVATDPRVFERITLGLYREPSAAIRELISNAYDADATSVTVTMNPPLFDEILVEDDGIGMSLAAINQVVHHVGGSLKQSHLGQAAGINRTAGVSRGGRILVGQMGIGLYAVARLTRHFIIETKQKDDLHRVILDINLTGLNPDKLPEGVNDRFVAGYARVSREAVSSSQKEEHYTHIRLLNILPDAKKILQSVDRWDDYNAKLAYRARGMMRYHIGRSSDQKLPNLPWHDPRLKPNEKFITLVDGLSTRVEASQSSPSLDETLDYYLAMLWRISLSAPLRYVEKHPFSLSGKELDFYSLDGDGTPERIELGDSETIGSRLKVSELGTSPTKFTLTVDGVELKRPAIFRRFATDNRKLLPRPKLFVGQFASESEGAMLKCTAYFFWSYEIKPKENNGVLVRIAGASGTLFDPGFLDFRTSENLRLRQVSAEIFVQQGLQQALNVDRESFVDSDPNYRALQRWVHRCMTRIFTRLKLDQRNLGQLRKDIDEAQEANSTVELGKEIWTRNTRDSRRRLPEVIVSTRNDAPLDLDKDAIFIGDIPSERRGGVEKEQLFSARLRSIVYVLDSWGLLDGLSGKERSALIRDITKVLDRR